jgi:LPPG:FO 2-phospho-L-lactate transferase
MVYLSGGVGGARLLDGLNRCVPPEALTVIVNTADDLVHWGLHVSPDVDTVLYTLSGLADEKRGWGQKSETWKALDTVKRLGGETWFQLGDRDLGLHLMRTRWLAEGVTLTEATARLAKALGVKCSVLPMSDEPVRTMIDTVDDGTLGFQQWLVERRAEPKPRAVRFEGGGKPSAAVLEALRIAELVVIGPSNPYVSIDPMLSMPGMREALAGKRVVAVSPIVGGKAVKGPLAEMIPTLAGRPASATAIAAHYGALLSGLVVERGDEEGFGELRVMATATVMHSRTERTRLARELLAFARMLGRR